MPTKKELIAFVVGIALGASPDQPIVEILMRHLEITDAEMNQAVKIYLPFVRATSNERR